MTFLAVTFIVLGAFAALVWSVRHVLIWCERRSGCVLTPAYAGSPPADAPMISVLVAAKDEEANIATCVETMLRQDYPNFELIVCNDRSTDRTAEIVSEIAKRDSRLKLVNITQLPEGWCGKNNAMQTGIAASRGQYIVMIDADCRQESPNTLTAAMRNFREHKADMLSILPVLEMKGFWENVIQPVCGGVMMTWFPPNRVNNPRSKAAYANGAFMMLTREAYEKVGRHEAVKACVNEDIHLAAAVKRAGLNLRVARSNGLYQVRMYTSFQQIVRGWTRIFYGSFSRFSRMFLSAAVLVIMGLLPHAATILCLALAYAGVAPHGLWLAAGLVSLTAVLMQLTVMFRFYRLICGRPELCWTFPIGSVIATWCLIGAMGKLRKNSQIVWRGTAYTPPAKC